ncbi:MAG: exodeoxyribonuclease VII small subunit [Pseudomonadota bacterium]
MVKTSRPSPPATFEAALAELEAIVREMEAGQLPLEESLASYERGTVLLKHCQEVLGAAEKKLLILENGGLRDFDLDSGKPEPDASDA